jgi:hypothetical protein
VIPSARTRARERTAIFKSRRNDMPVLQGGRFRGEKSIDEYVDIN